MTLFFQLITSLFIAGFLLVFFSDCAKRQLLYKYLGILLMFPAVVVALVSVFVGVWTI